jgi:hypothetical protein
MPDKQGGRKVAGRVEFIGTPLRQLWLEPAREAIALAGSENRER